MHEVDNLQKIGTGVGADVKDLKEDEQMKPDKKYVTGVGLQCVTMLWAVDQDFKSFADAVFYKANSNDEEVDNE